MRVQVLGWDNPREVRLTKNEVIFFVKADCDCSICSQRVQEVMWTLFHRKIPAKWVGGAVHLPLPPPGKSIVSYLDETISNTGIPGGVREVT